MKSAKPYSTGLSELRLKLGIKPSPAQTGTDVRAAAFRQRVDAVVQKSANNLAGVKTLMAHYLNVIDLLNFDTVVISRAAVDVIESYLGQGDTATDAEVANGEA